MSGGNKTSQQTCFDGGLDIQLEEIPQVYIQKTKKHSPSCIDQSREDKHFFKSHFFEAKTNIFMPSFFEQLQLQSKNKPRLESTKRGCFL